MKTSPRFLSPRLASLVLGVVIATSLPGCSSNSVPGGFDYQCPENGLSLISLIDISASGRAESTLSERLNAIQVDAEYAADCDANHTVVAWAGSSSASSVLYSGVLTTAGATEIGKDRKIPKLVSGTMDEIRSKMSLALAEISPDVSDLLAGFTLAADLATQSRIQGKQIEVHIYTDGISTSGSAQSNDSEFTDEVATELISNLPIPDLRGYDVILFGVGRVSGVSAPPQDYIDVILDFSSSLCKATGAECLVFNTMIAS